MDVFDRLKAVALQQNLSGEFPSWLMTEVMVIVERPQRYADRINQVELLTTQINDYDPYAGAGCFGASVSAGAIQATLRAIMS